MYSDLHYNITTPIIVQLSVLFECEENFFLLGYDCESIQ